MYFVTNLFAALQCQCTLTITSFFSCLSRPDERKSGAVGNQRRLRLHLDPAQYYADMRDGVDCYESLNLLVRRNAKENNFKAILHTIRDLINTAAVGRAIPAWLNDVFLGYGRPEEANYR